MHKAVHGSEAQPYEYASLCSYSPLQLRHEPDVRQTELEMERAREKIRDVTERLQELASES